MKIDSINIKTVQNRKRIKKPSADQGVLPFITTTGAEETETIQKTTQLENIRHMSTITSPQALTERNLEHGDRILDSLGMLQKSLLESEDLTEGIEKIRHILAGPTTQASQPHIRELLDMIELRAEVEIAKAEFQSKKTSSL